MFTFTYQNRPRDKPRDKPSETADTVPNNRFNTIMRNRDISIFRVDLDVGEEKGCSWTKVGLPTTYTKHVLAGARRFLTVTFK